MKSVVATGVVMALVSVALGAGVVIGGFFLIKWFVSIW